MSINLEFTFTFILKESLDSISFDDSKGYFFLSIFFWWFFFALLKNYYIFEILQKGEILKELQDDSLKMIHFDSNVCSNEILKKFQDDFTNVRFNYGRVQDQTSILDIIKIPERRSVIKVSFFCFIENFYLFFYSITNNKFSDVKYLFKKLYFIDTLVLFFLFV